MAWLLCGFGTLFCLTGAWVFHKNIYEEDRGLRTALLLMIAGLILIGLGTARYVFAR